MVYNKGGHRAARAAKNIENIFTMKFTHQYQLLYHIFFPDFLSDVCIFFSS